MKQIKPEEDFEIELKSTSLDIQMFKMVWIPPGECLMGVPLDQQSLFYASGGAFQFKTKVSKGYWIGQYLVTQAHWLKLGGANKNWFPKNHLDYPVYGVNWLEVMRFCKSLNTSLLELCPHNYHFSLPTELHWEYACRAGEEPINEVNEAKYNVLSDYIAIADKPYKVGQQKPNAWQLYDMLGNVSEWCFDITEEYSDESSDDWIGNEGIGFDTEYDADGLIIGTGRYRSIRGSSRLTSYREFADNGIGTYLDEKTNSVMPLSLGFRVCLRPITEWDLNDPLLKKHNINMIG